MSKRVSTTDAWRPISRRADFTTHGSLGGSTDPNVIGTGYLSGEDRAAYTWARSGGVIDYVVFSYGTPIGWHIPGRGWVIPATRYSRTTSKHQSALRRGAQESGDPIEGIGADRLQDASTGGAWS